MSNELKPIKSESGNIVAAGYGAETQTLVVEFKGGKKYRYPNVSPELWQKFETTFGGTGNISAGKFFFANIRSLPCEKIEE